MKLILVVVLSLFIIGLVSADYDNCNIYGNCKPVTSGTTNINNSYTTINNTYQNITNNYLTNDSYVPYTGATTDVDLGNYKITTTGNGAVGNLFVGGTSDTGISGFENVRLVGGDSVGISLKASGGIDAYPEINFGSSGGTSSSPTTTTVQMGALTGWSYNPTGEWRQNTEIRFDIDGVQNPFSRPSKIDFYATSAVNYADNYNIFSLKYDRAILNGKLGFLETGTSPTYYTYFQGGDQSTNINYTLPKTLPTSNFSALTGNSNGTLSWEVYCLANGTNCQSSGTNYTNLALTNQTNTFTTNQYFEGNITNSVNTTRGMYICPSGTVIIGNLSLASTEC